jgi:xylose isomerase
MKVVYKYKIPLEEVFFLELPKDAQILSFQMQYDIPTIWALVDRYSLDHENEKRTFTFVGTGHMLPDVISPNASLQYVGTAMMHGGQFVWHLFEIVSES